MKMINFKTNLAGFAGLFTAAGQALTAASNKDYIGAAATVMLSLGLLGAKDNNVTGAGDTARSVN